MVKNLSIKFDIVYSENPFNRTTNRKGDTKYG